MSNNELMINQKKEEVTKAIQTTVENYYNIDLKATDAETLKKKQNIAMFVSKLIQTQTKKDKETGETKPAILTASADSIRECALAYVNGDFDFFRNQAYLIAYGNSIQFIVGKDGLVSSAKKIVPGLEIFSEIVYKNDKFEYNKIGGRTLVTNHEQPIENITCKIEDIVCAYACAWKDGVQVEAEIMTKQEIINALTTAKRSLTDFHKNNPKIMLGKFPLRRLCKKIINQNIAPEVSSVLGDSDDHISVEATPVENTPVALNFEEKTTKPQGKASAKKSLEKVDNDPIFDEVVSNDTYESSKFEDSVSIFDMPNENTKETTKRVLYSDWKNGLKQELESEGWRMTANSYDATTKTIEVTKN